MNTGALSQTMAPKKQKSSVDRQIDENLKRVFNDDLQQELPDKFLSLIEQLKTKESGEDDK